MTNTIDLHPVLHTWRDGTFYWDGLWSDSEHRPPTAHLADEKRLDRVIEIRHLKGSHLEGFGHILDWKKDQEKGWGSKVLGEYREEDLGWLLSK